MVGLSAIARAAESTAPPWQFEAMDRSSSDGSEVRDIGIIDLLPRSQTCGVPAEIAGSAATFPRLASTRRTGRTPPGKRSPHPSIWRGRRYLARGGQ